jgi:uncharacterized membrane protein YphA (DoxX/SURF4 family)
MAALTVLYAADVLAVSAVLTWSGLEKIRDTTQLAATLSQLGIPHRHARGAAIAVPLSELAIVALLAVGAYPYLTASLVTLLGFSFATAAIISKLTGQIIPCACFGTAHRNLGWPQLAALPFWLFSAWATLHIASASIGERLMGLACAIVALIAMRAVPVLRLGVNARSDRRAFMGG